MALYNHFPLIMIFLPMVASLVTPLLRSTKTARSVMWAVQLALALLSAGLFFSLESASVKAFTYSMGHFPAPWGNELRAGPLEALMSCAFAAVMFFSIHGGARDADADLRAGKGHYFYLMIGLITTSLMALVYTNDIFTAYVFIEINTLAACATVVAKESGETVKATIKYVVMSAIGSGMFLLAIAILYGITGQLLMTPAHNAISAIVASGQYHIPLMTSLILFATAIAVKSALLPFHSWLPDAHAYATTTSSSVLSGLVLKGYIVLLIKLLLRVYGIDVVTALGVLPPLFVLGMAAMIGGSLIAFRQKHLKLMIAYSTVAQIGYIFMGIGLNTTAGFTAACYHIIAHAFTKSMLFIAAGALINAAGSKNIADMVGAARKNKIAGAAFVVGSLSMIGVPFFAGFPSKFYLAGAAMQGSYGIWIAVTVLALSTFLSALYYVPTVLKIYAIGGKQENAPKAGELPAEEIKHIAAPTLTCLMAVNVALGIFYVPLLSAIERGLALLG